MRETRKRGYLNQFVRFALTGLISTVINLILLYVLTEYAGFLYILSAFFAYVAGTIVSYSVNRIWTFRIYDKKIVYRRYFDYLVLSLLSMCIGLVILTILVEFAGMWYMNAQLFSLFLGMVVNFNLQKYYTFGDSRKREKL